MQLRDKHNSGGEQLDVQSVDELEKIKQRYSEYVKSMYYWPGCGYDVKKVLPVQEEALDI